jgi:hypothetical protein
VRNPNVCSFCGAERPGELRVVSKKRRIQICVDCAQRCHEIAAEGKERKLPYLVETPPVAAEPEAPGRRMMLQRLAARRFVLVAALPRNDARLAAAAVQTGADAIEAHLYLDEAAGGVVYGGLRDEGPAIMSIVDAAAGAPVGVVPGQRRMASPEEMAALDAMGLDFFGVGAQWMPAWMLADNGLQMSAMMALGPGTTLEQARDLLETPAPGRRVDMVEAAVMPESKREQPLTAWDLAFYSRLASVAAPKPLLVRAQCMVRPEELALLAEGGVRGLVVGHAVFPGKDSDSVRRVVEAYAQAVAAL